MLCYDYLEFEERSENMIKFDKKWIQDNIFSSDYNENLIVFSFVLA